MKKIEKNLEKKIVTLNDRAEDIKNNLEGGKIHLMIFGEAESLIFIKKGIIERYLGGIYYYEIRDIKIGEFYLIDKKEKIFYVNRISEKVYYLNYMFLLDDIQITSRYQDASYGSNIKYVKSEIKKDQIKNTLSSINKSNDIVFYYQSFLKYSNDQLIYNLELSGSQFDEYNHRKRVFLRILLLFFILLCQIIYLVIQKRRDPDRTYFYNRFIVGILYIMALPSIYLLSTLDGKSFFYVILGFKIKSIHQVLIIALLFFATIHFFTNKLKKNYGFSVALFLLSIPLVNFYLNLTVHSILFPIFRFELKFEYLSFIITLFIIYFLPYLFIRNISLNKSKRLIILGFSLIILLVIYWIFSLNLLIILIYFCMLSSQLFLNQKELIKGFIIVFLISIVLVSFVSIKSRKEKNSYISKSLKTVFISQNNYAKFIVRSCVNAIRSRNISYHEFFVGDKSRELESIWQSSLAASENVPSGIFIISSEGEIINDYFYQMPYYGKEGIDQLPFWGIEDRTVQVNNTRITYAVGFIEVIKDSEYIGDIVIQVSNSPELILRFQEEDNIFLLNKKISGDDISYIKFDNRQHVIENPGNIELKINNNKSDYWFDFWISNKGYHGYIFENKGNTIVIYYPKRSVFTSFANYIKILIFLLILFSFTNFGYIRNLKWKDFYYSFSLRVFIILIILSVFTGGIFSLFSVNFTSDLINSNYKNELLKKGRIAQNIAFEMLKDKEELDKSSLFNLSKIMNQAVSVYKYQNNKYHQWDASNNKMIINNEIPIFLHSQVIDFLESKNEKIVLLDDHNRLNLLFKVKNYIFSVEILFNKSIIITQRAQYMDFITSLLFILIFIGIAAAIFFRNKILTPINDLNQGMSEVERGNLKSLKVIPSEIDLKRLYQRFNSMIEGIKDQKEKISEMSRFETMIKLGRRVAHEVKNPLTPIKLSAEQIKQSINDKTEGYEKLIRDSVKYIIDETEHLKKVSYGFLNLSKIDKLEKEYFDVVVFTREQYLKFNLSYSKTHFEFMDEVKEQEVYWDKGKIEEILNNFIANSVEAIPSNRDGTIFMTIFRKGTNYICFKIKDNGMGIEPGEIKDIFKENYSRKDIGSGLGLYIAKRIVHLHQGEISISSKKDLGTTVLVEIPIKC